MFFVSIKQRMLGTASENTIPPKFYHVRYIIYLVLHISFLKYPAFPYVHPLRTHTHFEATLLSDDKACTLYAFFEKCWQFSEVLGI